ncbi:MAG: DUF3047 domain-containing protein [Rhodospirillales bacterium]
MQRNRPAILFRSALVAATLTLGGHANADAALPIRPDLNPGGWEMLRFKGVPETTFLAAPDGAMDVRADKSSSVLYLKIADDPVAATRLSWDWQVIDALPATDLTKTDGDDRMLSIYVAFSDGSMASKLKAMISPLAAGNVLNYVWGGVAKLDIPHPHFPDSGRLIVKRTIAAPTGRWLSETVDLEADYRRAFGVPPPGIAYIGISGDADDLARVSRGLIRNITLE